MPRPYFIPRERRNPQEDRLAQLAAIAQIYSGLQGTQQQQQNDMQRNALGILGLVMNNEREQEQMRQAQADRDMRSGQFWEGEMPLKYAQEQRQIDEAKAAQTYRDAMIAEQKATRADRSGEFWSGELPMKYYGLEQEKEQANKSLAAHLFSTAAGAPGVNLQQALRVAGIHDPALSQEAATMEQERRGAILSQVIPELAAIKDPRAREMHGRARIPWEGGFEEAMAKAYPQTTAPSSTVPGAVNGPARGQDPADFERRTNALELLNLLRQEDPKTYKEFQRLQGVHQPGGQGTAYEGSPLYLRKKREADEADRLRAAMLAPYLFRKIGTPPPSQFPGISS